MSRITIPSLATIPPLLKLPLSARTMRVFQPRVATGVAWCEVTDGGTGYLDTFNVTFSGGGGTGASGIGRAKGGVLQCIAITSYGSGYTTNPTAVLTAGGGSGASVTVYRVDPGADAAALGITDVVWCYINNDLTFAQSITSRGINLQGTINGLVDYPAGNAAASLAYNGEPVPVAWLLPEARAFGASRRAGYLSIKRAEVQALTGVTSAHFDDPAPDLSSIIASSNSRSGGSFDAETLAGFRPFYATELQNAGITQDNFNWNTKTWTTTNGNWTSTNPGINGSAPNRAEFLAHLRNGVVEFHQTLKQFYSPQIKYRSGNCFDPMPRADYSGWQLPAFDVAMFETETPQYSGVSPANYAERFTRLWVNIKTCEGAGVDSVPHLQPLRNDETYASSRAMRVAVLKQQIALSYALGGRPTYPYDIYLYPWNAGQNERWFAKTGDGFGPMYDLVRNNPTLFDGTRSMGALLLVCDVDTSTNRAVSDSNILGWADTCLRNSIPAIIYPLGGTYQRRPELEAKALRVVDCSGPSSVTSALSTLPNYRTLAQMPFSTSWPNWSAGKLTGTFTDVFAIFRYSDNGRTIIHLVNCDGVARPNLTLNINWWALNSTRHRQIRFFSPGATPSILRGVDTDSGLQIALPSLPEWSILELSNP